MRKECLEKPRLKLGNYSANLATFAQLAYDQGGKRLVGHRLLGASHLPLSLQSSASIKFERSEVSSISTPCVTRHDNGAVFPGCHPFGNMILFTVASTLLERKRAKEYH